VYPGARYRGQEFQSSINHVFFDPFLRPRRPEAALGSGWPSPHSIVQQHGGTLQLECGAGMDAVGETGGRHWHDRQQNVRAEGSSEEGPRGAAFVIRLPAPKEAQ